MIKKLKHSQDANTTMQVEWTMQVNEGGTTDPIEAGYSEGDYTTYEIEEKVKRQLLK